MSVNPIRCLVTASWLTSGRERLARTETPSARTAMAEMRILVRFIMLWFDVGWGRHNSPATRTKNKRRFPKTMRLPVKMKREKSMHLGDYEVHKAWEGFASIRQISSGEIMHSRTSPIAD